MLFGMFYFWMSKSSMDVIESFFYDGIDSRQYLSWQLLTVALPRLQFGILIVGITHFADLKNISPRISLVGPSYLMLSIAFVKSSQLVFFYR